jgi:uncharacterized membrane protein YqjE
MTPQIPSSPPPEDRSVGKLLFDVSDQISALVREEVELAKAEVSEKVNSLAKGSAVGIAAGVFALLGLAMLMHAIAWLLNELFFEDAVWVGFAIEALFWFIVAAIAGLLARRSIQAGSPPMPEQAIEEAKRVRQTLEAGTTPVAREPTATPGGAPPGPVTASEPTGGPPASGQPLSGER